MTQHYETRNLQWYHWVHFLLTIDLLLGMQPSLKKSLFPQWVSTGKKLIFIFKLLPFGDSFSLGLDGGMCAFLLWALGPHLVKTHAGLVFVASVFVNSCVHWSCWVGDPSCTSSPHVLSSFSSLIPMGSDFMEPFYLWLSISRPLSLCIMSDCGSLHVFPSATIGGFSNES